MSALIYGAVGIGSVAIVVAMLKSGHAGKALCLSILQGLAALFAVNVLGGLSGVSLSINWTTIASSCIGGVPGVILLLVMQVLCRK